MPERDTLLFSVARREPEGSCTNDLYHLSGRIAEVPVAEFAEARARILAINPCEAFRAQFTAGLTARDIRDIVQSDIATMRAYLVELEPSVRAYVDGVWQGAPYSVRDLDNCARRSAPCPPLGNHMQQASTAYLVTVVALMGYEETLRQIETYLR